MNGYHPAARFGRYNLLALGALAGWSWWIATLGLELGLPGTDLMSLARGLPAQAAWFVPVGLLVPVALPRMRSLLARFVLVLLPSLALGALVVALIIAAPPENPTAVLHNFVVPGPFVLFVPMVGMGVGVLLGALFTGHPGTALLMIPALLALAVVLLAMAAVALLLLTDRIPTAEPIGRMGDASSLALLADLRDGAPIEAEELALALPLLTEAGVDPATRISVSRSADGVLARISFPWTLPWIGLRYLNAEAVAAPSTEDGVFRMGIRSVSVGGLSAPSVVVRMGSRAASRWVRELLPFATGPGPANARLDALLEGLEGEAPEIRGSSNRLAGAITAAFSLARDRHRGGDAVGANRLALLALAGAGGHPSLLTFAGFPDSVAFASRLGQKLEVTVDSRGDWARHFLLSAGLTQVGPDGMTEQAGELKEFMDAASGSGFSFADLLMDRAGALFGRTATRDPATARRLQARIAAGIVDADLIPEVAGLPEGISHERLEAEFGGPRGGGFQELEAEIERRLAGLTLYR